MVDEKQLLVDTLKFTPRNIRISILGYGGEIVMGTISKEAYDYWADKDEDVLSDFVVGESLPDDMPESAKFVEPGAWYECDDIAHESGVELASHGYLSVVDVESNEMLFETKSLDLGNLDDLDITTECVNEYYASFQPADSYCFYGQSIEKGLFFEAEFEIRRPFDPNRIHIYYNEIEGVPIFFYMSYDGEDIEDPGSYDTTGKAIHFAVMKSDD